MATRQAAGTGAFAFLRKRAFARPHFRRGPKIVAIVALVLVALIAAAIASKNARLDTSTGFVKVTPDSDGRALDVDKAKTILIAGVQHGDKQINLPVIHPKATVRQDSFATVILVRTGENKLYLYKNGQVSRTYDVATGRTEFPTPTGQYRIVSKQTNPVWLNPHSDWSNSMPARIEPG